MLSCREITELATAFDERALPLGARLRFLLHLSMCKRCRRYLQQLRLTIRAVARLATQAPPAHLREALLENFRRAKPKQ